MPWDVLIRGGEVVTQDGVRRLDIAIEDGAIVELEPKLSGSAREEVDAAGLHVCQLHLPRRVDARLGGHRH